MQEKFCFNSVKLIHKERGGGGQILGVGQISWDTGARKKIGARYAHVSACAKWSITEILRWMQNNIVKGISCIRQYVRISCQNNKQAKISIRF